MRSKWYKLKSKAVSMRKNGASLRDVETALKIPRSTLSYWFSSVKLTPEQKLSLNLRWKRALIRARKAAVVWHNQQKSNRLEEAESSAKEVLGKLNTNNPSILNLALSMLYLGEGFKSSTLTGMGNSDPMILKFFIAALSKNYRIPINKIKCEIHLRADQEPKKIKRYWSKELGLPLNNFLSISIDKRTAGSPTYPTYKGVCIVRCGSVAIQRELMYISRIFCQEVIKTWTRSSIG